MPQKQLTLRQLKFCQEYLKNGGCATKSAVAAGYTEKNARNIGRLLFKKPWVQAYLNAHLEKVQKKFEWTFEERLAFLQGIAIDCKEGRAHDKSTATRPVINASGAISAIGEANKMLNDYKPNKSGNLDIIKSKIDELMEEVKKEY